MDGFRHTPDSSLKSGSNLQNGTRQLNGLSAEKLDEPARSRSTEDAGGVMGTPSPDGAGASRTIAVRTVRRTQAVGAAISESVGCNRSSNGWRGRIEFVSARSGIRTFGPSVKY